ncbi:hypothetical protein PV04_09763 [Phialophora macrospora]|uniref:Uncharacterized protein n=1 Tax=Phialophora macrospora TaxID=1851006 RepID=A0A0D2CCS7_9EURO|nr:hypothetical protein PV04_09763 [Phialophora macrospora]
MIPARRISRACWGASTKLWRSARTVVAPILSITLLIVSTFACLSLYTYLVDQWGALEPPTAPQTCICGGGRRSVQSDRALFSLDSTYPVAAVDEYCESLPRLQSLYTYFSRDLDDEYLRRPAGAVQDDLNRLLVDASAGKDLLSKLIQPDAGRSDDPDGAEGKSRGPPGPLQAIIWRKIRNNFGRALLGQLGYFDDGLPPLAALIAQYEQKRSASQRIRETADLLFPAYSQILSVMEEGLAILSDNCEDGIDSQGCAHATVSRARLIHSAVQVNIARNPEHNQTLYLHLYPCG